ncbi:cold shock domain-containing protein [Pectinatus frisingensis]|uniref:cold shock domain-containing protein n=1 Tax=Pectinatus frisingensis TaxID=865 RepID=UPI0018C51F61|nr:cold shock domain-containing protein [Pectinatus frisingensis]
MQKGIISELYRPRGYGFIRSMNEEKVFFHASNLVNVKYEKLKEGDIVHFETLKNNKGYKAINIKCQFENKTTPGINPAVKLGHFNSSEKDILNALSKIFYLTNGGAVFKMGTNSQYAYCLLKPTTFFSEQFNLNREIVLVFSNYETFEPRTLDAISKAYSLVSELRVDKICSIVVSKDSQFEKKLKDLLKSNIEMQVVIPFSYGELLSIIKFPDKYYDLIIKRFRTYFYERDLFAFFAPLQKDLYFFGRQAYVQDLVNKHFTNENSGVFGLRRSGKTSVLNAVCRTLNRIDGKWILIDCEVLSNLRWNTALYYIVQAICKQYKIKLLHNKMDYTDEDVAILFEQDMLYCNDQLKGKSLLVLIDEIEHITFEIALSNNWRKDDDFIRFWRVLRGYYQKYPNKMTFIIAGTNPKSIETSFIDGYDNPLFKQLPSDKYLGTFSVQDTKEMINKLGAYMGLKFDDIVSANISQEMGGHPFLIRQFCSKVNEFINQKHLEKPIVITKVIYDQVLPIFEEKDLHDYCEMIINVLKTSYSEEYKMLENIALENKQVILEQRDNKSIFYHLIGYGLIEKTGDFFGFRNEAVKKYIQQKNKYNKLLKTDEEKWAEISERRNKIEPSLRTIVKLQLKSSLGETTGKTKILNAMKAETQQKYKSLSYNDLFDTKKCEVYFYQMSKIIIDNWKLFSNLFSLNKNTFQSYTTIINNLRADCHAAPVSNSELQSFRGAISSLEKEINNAV